MREDNGRVKLSWAQIAWAVSMIVAVLATWADLRVQMTRVESKLERHAERIAALEARNAIHGFTQQDADRMRDEILQTVKKAKR